MDTVSTFNSFPHSGNQIKEKISDQELIKSKNPAGSILKAIDSGSLRVIGHHTLLKNELGKNLIEFFNSMQRNGEVAKLLLTHNNYHGPAMAVVLMDKSTKEEQKYSALFFDHNFLPCTCEDIVSSCTYEDISSFENKALEDCIVDKFPDQKFFYPTEYKFI